MMAAAVVPALGMTGAGIDLGRAYMVQAQLSSALDAAVLAGAREQGNWERRAEIINTYFRANFPEDYMGAQVGELAISQPDPADGGGGGRSIDVAVSAEAVVPMLFMGILGEGFSTMAVNAVTRAATAETIGSTHALEVMLAIDNTGSMTTADAGGGMTRIQAVKNAANAFVDIVYNGEESNEDMAVGIVPFTVMANAGRLLKPGLVNAVPDYTTRAATDPWGWAGCLAEDGWWSGTPRTGILSSDRTAMDVNAYDLNLDNPLSSAAPKWDPYLFPPVAVLAFQNIQNYYRAPDTSFATNPNSVWYKAFTRGYAQRAAESGGPNLFISDGDPTTPDPINLSGGGLSERTWLAASGDRSPAEIGYASWEAPKVYGRTTKWDASPNFHCPSEALPPRWGVTKTDLKDYIRDNNDAYNPGLGTFTHTGFVWAWRFLKSKDMFNGLTAVPSGKPTKQALVLFTDGIIDASDRGSRWSGERDTNYSPYGTYEQRLVDTSSSPSRVKSAMDLRLAKSCAAAKASGVVVYVVALRASTTTYQLCASSERHFFATTNGDDLREAFEAIAYDLVPLHLVQ